MRRLGGGEISFPFESLTHLEEVGRQVWPANIDTEAIDEATAVDDGAAGFPEGAQLPRARLGLTLSDEAKRAVLAFDLTHVSSVDVSGARHIRLLAD